MSYKKKYEGCSVVRNVSMHVPKGQIYGLLGRNGAGKTTIMKMVLGLVKKDSGSVTLFNQEMADYQSGIYARIGSTIESPRLLFKSDSNGKSLSFLKTEGKSE